MRERVSREEKMSRIQRQLEDGVREIYTSEKYKDYIRAMSKFPSYSTNNCILIASQCPQASLVCGFHKWQAEFNRTVNKGEHGIMIMAPIRGKSQVEEELFDENNHLIRDEDGNPKTELFTKEYQTFRPDAYEHPSVCIILEPYREHFIVTDIKVTVLDLTQALGA